MQADITLFSKKKNASWYNIIFKKKNASWYDIILKKNASWYNIIFQKKEKIKKQQGVFNRIGHIKNSVWLRKVQGDFISFISHMGK